MVCCHIKSDKPPRRVPLCSGDALTAACVMAGDEAPLCRSPPTRPLTICVAGRKPDIKVSISWCDENGKRPQFNIARSQLATSYTEEENCLMRYFPNAWVRFEGLPVIPFRPLRSEHQSLSFTTGWKLISSRSASRPLVPAESYPLSRIVLLSWL